jgi:hypothetical protein
MKQEDVAGKIVLELVNEGIIQERDDWIVYNYLMQAYAAGFNEGNRRITRPQPVSQFNSKGELVALYPTIRKAAKGVGVNESSIKRALSGRYKTVKGFTFKYTNVKKPISSGTQTIGSTRSK